MPYRADGSSFCTKNGIEVFFHNIKIIEDEVFKDKESDDIIKEDNKNGKNGYHHNHFSCGPQFIHFLFIT